MMFASFEFDVKVFIWDKFPRFIFWGFDFFYLLKYFICFGSYDERRIYLSSRKRNVKNS